MARYFFDFQDSAGVPSTDDEGLDLPNVARATREAIIALTAHGAEVLPDAGPSRISVCIRRGQTVVGEVALCLSFEPSLADEEAIK